MTGVLTDITVFAGPPRLAVTDVVPYQVLAVVGVETGTALALVGVQLALRTLPLRPALTLVPVNVVNTCTVMEARTRLAFVYICTDNDRKLWQYPCQLRERET